MKPSLRFSILVCPLLLIALQFAVYLPVLNSSFVHYDDNTYVYDNKNVKTLNAETVSGMFARPFFRSYTPIAILSHAIDYALWAGNPFGHHLTSLILHAVNVVLVFLLGAVLLSLGSRDEPGNGEAGLFSRLTESAIAAACAAAALYSLHPLRVESVAWISDRKDLLLALFLIPSVLAYLKYDALRGTRKAVRWFLIMLAFNVLALLSKTIATVTPLLLLSLDALLLHRRATRVEWMSLIIEKTPLFILSIGFGLLGMWAARGSLTSSIVHHMTAAERILLPFYTLSFYPVKYLIPTGITPIYASPDFGWLVAGTLLTLLLVTAAVREAWRGNVGWLLVLAGYAIPILPTITGLSAGIQPWADRYSYVPSIALFMLAGGGMKLLWERRTARWHAGIVGAVVIILSLFTWMDRQQISIWKDSETLWRAAVHEAPAVPMTYDNLGVALADKGEYDAALNMYQIAVRLEPTFGDAYYNAAIVFQAKKMPDSALVYYARALNADTGYVDAYINLGNMHVELGNRDLAIELYRRGLAIEEANADAHYNLGCALYYNGDPQGALASFARTITLSPNYAKAYYNMGVVFMDLKRGNAAVESFLHAAQLGDTDAQAQLARRGYRWN